MLAAAAIAATSGGAPITVEVDGQVRQVRVHAGTVAAALAEADIPLAAVDEVHPRRGAPVAPDLAVVVRRAIDVDIAIDGLHVERLTAPVATVGEALDEAGLTAAVHAGARITPALDTSLRDGATVRVLRPVDVQVEADGVTHQVAVVEPVVGDVLDLAGVALGSADLVTPAPDRPVPAGTTIRVARVHVTEVVEPVTVEPDERRVETAALQRGSTRVRDEGREGVLEERWRVRFVDGEVDGRTLLDRDVVTEPVDRVVEVGTRAEAAPTTGDRVWDRLAACESNGNWQIATGNGYYGGLQFHPDTWRRVGGTGLPHEHSREEQIRRGKILQQRSGWGQWPSCARRLGLL